MSKIPEKLNDYRVYLDAVELVGTADVTLPSLEFTSETIKGAGVAGEVDSPNIGHLGAMTLSLNWRTITDALAKLAAPKAHHLEARGTMQTYDSGAGTYSQVPVKVVCKGIPKKIDLGKLEQGQAMDAASEFEVVYLKLTLDGKDRWEIDKFAYKCVIDGTDYLKDVRTNLGLGS